MSTLSVPRVLRPDSILLDREEMYKIDRYIGYDDGLREGRRRIRPNATPEFIIGVKMDEELGEIKCLATIVVVNMPDSLTNQIEAGAPLAIAAIELCGMEYYLLIFKSRSLGSDLDISDVLIDYDGEPEELLAQPDLFEPEY